MFEKVTFDELKSLSNDQFSEKFGVTKRQASKFRNHKGHLYQEFLKQKEKEHLNRPELWDVGTRVKVVYKNGNEEQLVITRKTDSGQMKTNSTLILKEVDGEAIIYSPKEIRPLVNSIVRL